MPKFYAAVTPAGVAGPRHDRIEGHPVSGTITSPFDEQRSGTINHTGLDIKAAPGTRIYVSEPALVLFRGQQLSTQFFSALVHQPPWRDAEDLGTYYAWADGVNSHKGGFGNWVNVQWRDGSYSSFAHLMKVPEHIKPGDTIPAGGFLGQVGTTGNSSGDHLHFDVRKAGTGEWPRRGQSDFLDPYSFILAPPPERTVQTLRQAMSQDEWEVAAVNAYWGVTPYKATHRRDGDEELVEVRWK